MLAVVEYLQVAVSFVVRDKVVWVVLADKAEFRDSADLTGAVLSPSSNSKVWVEY